MAATPLHDRAYAALKEALLEGRIAPGQPVTVASLASLLGTGTMPMREAVRRLTAEGGLAASRASTSASAPASVSGLVTSALPSCDSRAAGLV